MLAPAVSQKERFCKIYLDIFHLLSNHSSLLFILLPLFLGESLSSCSLIFHPGDSLCCSKWFTSLISPLLVALTLSLSPSPFISLSVSLAFLWCASFPGFEPVSLFLSQDLRTLFSSKQPDRICSQAAIVKADSSPTRLPRQLPQPTAVLSKS